MWIDTHCHLDASEFDADRQQVANAAEAAGVRGIVVPAVAVWNFEAVRALARHDARCVYALGIHPLCSPGAGQADLDTLRREVAASMGDPRFVEQGLKLGFGGNVTFSRARQIRRLATELPLEALVLETDAPDMAPAWLSDDQFGEQHKARNTPAEVAGVARVMAELRGIDAMTLAQATWRNAMDAMPRLAAFADTMAPPVSAGHTTSNSS